MVGKKKTNLIKKAMEDSSSEFSEIENNFGEDEVEQIKANNFDLIKSLTVPVAGTSAAQSKRPWNRPLEPLHAMNAVKPATAKWENKVKRRLEHTRMKEVESRVKGIQREVRTAEARKAEQRKQAKEANRLKNQKVQVISNIKKIKKLKKNKPNNVLMRDTTKVEKL